MESKLGRCVVLIMILDNLFSVYSPTPILIKMAERIIKRNHPDIRWPESSFVFGTATYIPIKDLKQAKEFVTQGGHLLWLEAPVHPAASDLYDDVISISGVNSFIACQFAVSVGLRHIFTEAQQYEELSVHILPQNPNFLKNFL